MEQGDRPIDRVRKVWLVKLISLSIILFLVVANAALIKICFFPAPELGEEAARLQKAKEPRTIWERLLKAKDIAEELKFSHFHNVDPTLKVEQRQPTLCLRCHGNYPHSKSKEIRALLNMHTFFGACELCHVRAAKDQAIKFNWYDNVTGEIVERIEAKDGNYGAKIVPALVTEKGMERFDRPVTEDYAKNFMANWSQYNYDQQAMAKFELHRALADKPVQCNECHRKKEAYLDFAELGYSKNWVIELAGTEVVGMVDKYMQFYIPTMFNVDEMRRQREELMRKAGIPIETELKIGEEPPPMEQPKK